MDQINLGDRKMNFEFWKFRRRNWFAGMMIGCAVSFCISTVNAQDDNKSVQGDSAQQTDAEKKVAEEKPIPPFTVTVAKGAIEFSVTGKWKNVPDKSNMIEEELKIPGETEKDDAGRLTIMGAGGTIEANITRWEGQFLGADGTSPGAKKETKEIAGLKVHLVDLQGTYLDSPRGPFAGGPTIKREDYRMLAAIIPTPKSGNYFVKFYGPKKLVDDNEEHFESMIESLKIKQD
jgi:hypothetical protein